MVTVQRVQTGVRMERDVVRVLRGLAAYLDMSLGELIEGIVLHAFEGQVAFGPSTLQAIEDLRRVYGLRLTAADSHRLVERSELSSDARERPADVSDEKSPPPRRKHRQPSGA